MSRKNQHIQHLLGQIKEMLRQQVHKYENLLNRNFRADRPNSKRVTDISYIHTKQGVRSVHDP